jgi:hypothetical protein
MQKRIAFIVGHENFGKSQTIRALKEMCGSRGRRIIIKNTEFLTRDASNDDRPRPYIKYMGKTRRTFIVATLCPKFKALRTNSPDKAIDKTLQSLRQRGYELFFWVIKHQWEAAGSNQVSRDEIKELGRYGTVRTLVDRNIDSKTRARRFRAFIEATALT